MHDPNIGCVGARKAAKPMGNAIGELLQFKIAHGLVSGDFSDRGSVLMRTR